MKQKITKDTVPEGFTLSLALFDALPVLFFGAGTVLLGVLFKNVLFLFGAVLCFWAGAAKVLWKIIVVTEKKNVWWLFLQMRTAMPAGFLLMLLSVICNRSGIRSSGFQNGVLSFPSVLFFALCLTGMLLMGIFAKKLDASNPRSNWIEQITNAAAQFCFLIGVLFLF